MNRSNSHQMKAVSVRIPRIPQVEMFKKRLIRILLCLMINTQAIFFTHSLHVSTCVGRTGTNEKTAASNRKTPTRSIYRLPFGFRHLDDILMNDDRCTIMIYWIRLIATVDVLHIGWYGCIDLCCTDVRGL